MGAYYQIQVKNRHNLTVIINPDAAKFLESNFYNDRVMRSVYGFLAESSSAERPVRVATVCDYDDNSDFEYQHVNDDDESLTELRKGGYLVWSSSSKDLLDAYRFTSQEAHFIRQIDAIVDGENYKLDGYIVCPTTETYFSLKAFEKIQEQIDNLNSRKMVGLLVSPYSKKMVGLLVNPLSILTRSTVDALGGGDANFAQPTMTKTQPYVGSWYNHLIYFDAKPPMGMRDISKDLMVMEANYEFDYPTEPLNYLLVDANDYLQKFAEASLRVEQNYQNSNYLFNAFFDKNVAVSATDLKILSHKLEINKAVKVTRVDTTEYESTPSYLFKDGFKIVKNKKEYHSEAFSFFEKTDNLQQKCHFDKWAVWNALSQLDKIDSVREFLSSLDSTYLSAISYCLGNFYAFLMPTLSNFSKEILQTNNDIAERLNNFVNNINVAPYNEVKLLDANMVVAKSLDVIADLYVIDKDAMTVRKLYGNNTIAAIELINEEKIAIYNYLNNEVSLFALQNNEFVPFLRHLIVSLNKNMHRLLLETQYQQHQLKPNSIVYTSSDRRLFTYNPVKAYQVLRIDDIDGVSGKMYLREVVVKPTKGDNGESLMVGLTNDFIGETLEGFTYIDSYGTLNFEVIMKKGEFDGLKIGSLYTV